MSKKPILLRIGHRSDRICWRWNWKCWPGAGLKTQRLSWFTIQPPGHSHSFFGGTGTNSQGTGHRPFPVYGAPAGHKQPKKQHIINSMCCFMRLFGFNPIKEAGAGRFLPLKKKLQRWRGRAAICPQSAKSVRQSMRPLPPKSRPYFRETDCQRMESFCFFWRPHPKYKSPQIQIIQNTNHPKTQTIPKHKSPKTQIIPKHKYPFNFPPFPGKYYQA